MIYKYLQYKIFILFKYILFILGLFVLLFLVFIKESFAYTATAPTSVCTNCTETVNNTTPGLNLNGLSSDNAAAGYQIHTQYINSNFIKGPIENAQYNITGSSFTGYSNGHNWGPIYNYWLDSSYYNSCSTYYLWNIGYTSNHSSPFCNRYDTPPTSTNIINDYTRSGTLDSNGNAYASSLPSSPSYSNLDCMFNDFTITLTIPKSSYNLTGYSPVAYENYSGSTGTVILYGKTYRTGVLLLGANISYSPSSGNFTVTITGVLLQNMQAMKISIYLVAPSSPTSPIPQWSCNLTLNANPTSNLNPETGSTTLSGVLTVEKNGQSIVTSAANQKIQLSQSSNSDGSIVISPNPATTNSSGDYSSSATMELPPFNGSVVFSAKYTSPISGIICSSASVTVTWGSSSSSSTCTLTLSANPTNPVYPDGTTLSGVVTKNNGSQVPAGSSVTISQNPSNASNLSPASPVITNGFGDFSTTAILTNQSISSVTYTANFNEGGSTCTASVTVTWRSINCSNNPSSSGCEPPVQPVCNRSAYRELYINGSLVGFGGIYNYRDMGGCNPQYPSLKVAYNLKYISLYNINFIRLIGHNIQYWLEEGI